MAKKPETVFRENSVLPFLKTLKNTHFFPIQQVAIRGTPDLLLCVLGTFVALELKAVSGQLHPLQIWHLAEVKRAGGVTLVASPTNWTHVQEILKRLDEGEPLD